MSMDLSAAMLEDIRDLLGRFTVMTANDIINSLRGSWRGGARDLASGRRWRIVFRDTDLADALKALGFAVRYRKSGAGVAIYIGREPFNCVPYHRGWVPVSERWPY